MSRLLFCYVNSERFDRTDIHPVRVVSDVFISS